MKKILIAIFILIIFSMSPAHAIVISGETQVTNAEEKNVNITGGTIDGTAIGGTTPAAGSFTNLDSSGNATIGGDTTLNGNVSVNSTTDGLEITSQGTSTADSQTINLYNFDSTSGSSVAVSAMPQVNYNHAWGSIGAVVPSEFGHMAGGIVGVNRSTGATPVYRTSGAYAWLVSPRWDYVTHDIVPELEYILGQNYNGVYGHVFRLDSGNLSLSGVDTDTFDRYPQDGMRLSIADGDVEIYDASTLGSELLTDNSFDAVGSWTEEGTGFTVAGDGDVNYSHVDTDISRLSLANSAMNNNPSKYGVRYAIQVVLANFASCGTDNVNLTRLYLNPTTAKCKTCADDTLLGNTGGRLITNQFQSGWYADTEGGAVFDDGTYDFIIETSNDISEFEIVAKSVTSCDFDITSVSMKKVDGGDLRVAGTLKSNISVLGYVVFPIPDSGDGNPATITIFDDELGSSFVILQCLDADGCTLTVAETAAFVETGKQVKFVNESLGVVTVTDVDGVCDLAGDADFVMTRPDTLTLIYTDARWAETSRSDN